MTAIYSFLYPRDSVKWLSGGYRRQRKDLDIAIMTENERDYSMNYWSEVMALPIVQPWRSGSLLERFCERLLTDGSGLILVDLPLPKWHKQRSPYQSYYGERKVQLVKRWAGRTRFVALDVSDLKAMSIPKDPGCLPTPRRSPLEAITVALYIDVSIPREPVGSIPAQAILTEHGRNQRMRSV